MRLDTATSDAGSCVRKKKYPSPSQKKYQPAGESKTDATESSQAPGDPEVSSLQDIASL
jgi:hypothetical protein